MVPPASADRPVFVYGTLRPGRGNWPVVEPWCRRHEPATLPGFALYALAYPVVAPIDDGEEVAAGRGAGPRTGSGVVGDLLWLDPAAVDQALARLDAFEGVVRGDPRRSYYQRNSHLVRAATGATHESWVYEPGVALLAQIGPEHRVPDDDWP